MNPKAKNLFLDFCTTAFYENKNPVMSYNPATNEIKIYDDIKIPQKLFEPRNKADFEREGYIDIYQACLLGETSCGLRWSFLLKTISQEV